jgi:CoA:oxalate CoA-transferase
MLDSALVTMGWVISNYLIAGTQPQPHGNDNFTAAPSGTFRTGAGLLNIAANKQEQFEALARVVGRPTWSRTPLRQARGRKQNRAALTPNSKPR